MIYDIYLIVSRLQYLENVLKSGNSLYATLVATQQFVT